MRHDKIAAAIYKELLKRYGFEYAEKSYNHHIDKESRVLESEDSTETKMPSIIYVMITIFNMDN